MDQYKMGVEKHTEWILARLERKVRPEYRAHCPVLQEMRYILVTIKETNLDAMDAEFGMPSLSNCEQCEGRCFKSE